MRSAPLFLCAGLALALCACPGPVKGPVVHPDAGGSGDAGCTPSCSNKACGSIDDCGGVCLAGSGCQDDGGCMASCAGVVCGSSDGCGSNCQVGSGCTAGADGGAGDAGADGGSSDAGADGGPPPITWNAMVMPHNSDGSNSSCENDGVHGIMGNATSDLYLACEVGYVWHWDGMSWGGAALYHDPDNGGSALGFNAIWVTPSNQVLLAGGRNGFTFCTSNCSVPGNFSYQPNPISPQYGVVKGFCSDGTNVFAVGYDDPYSTGGAGILWRWNPSTNSLDLLGEDMSHSSFLSCWVSPAGELLIAAQSQIIRYGSGTFAVENVNYPTGWTTNEISQQQWYVVAGSSAGAFAAGTKRYILQRNASKTWDFAYYPYQTSDTSDFQALAGVGSEFYAGGSYSPIDQIARFDGASWTRLPENQPNVGYFFWFRGMWPYDANTYYAWGAVNNGSCCQPALYKGTR